MFMCSNDGCSSNSGRVFGFLRGFIMNDILPVILIEMEHDEATRFWGYLAHY